MKASVFGPARFSPRTLLGPALGQAEAEPITITRELALAVGEAIQTLTQNLGDPEIYTKEACWRDIRSRRWPHVTALQNKLSRFLSTSDEEMVVTDDEWSLTEKLIECVEALGALTHQTTESTLRTVGTLVGVAGGLATLVALL